MAKKKEKAPKSETETEDEETPVYHDISQEDMEMEREEPVTEDDIVP